MNLLIMHLRYNDEEPKTTIIMTTRLANNNEKVRKTRSCCKREVKRFDSMNTMFRSKEKEEK